MAENYRRKYENYLNRLLPREVHVHHMDHDRSNNDISNLVAIPNSLHGRYHFTYGFYHQTLSHYGGAKMPTKRQASMFHFSRLNDGTWNTSFKGTELEFLYVCQTVSYAIRANGFIKEARANYVKCLKQILKYKKQQSR